MAVPETPSKISQVWEKEASKVEDLTESELELSKQIATRILRFRDVFDQHNENGRLPVDTPLLIDTLSSIDAPSSHRDHLVELIIDFCQDQEQVMLETPYSVGDLGANYYYELVNYHRGWANPPAPSTARISGTHREILTDRWTQRPNIELGEYNWGNLKVVEFARKPKLDQFVILGILTEALDKTLEEQYPTS